MSSLWNFVKRHRGKIIVTGAVAGGAYVAKKILDEHPELTRSLFGSNQLSPLEEELKSDYVFASQQRSCDTSLEELAPKLASKVAEKWDLEAQAEAIRKGSNLTAAQKKSAWEQMKLESIARFIGSAYAQAVLVLALKTQMSIVAGIIYRKSAKAKPQPMAPLQELRTAAESLWTWFSETIQGAPAQADVPGSSNGPQVNGIIHTREERPSTPAPEAQALFLQSLQYFILIGMGRLLERVEKAVKQVLSELELPLTFNLNEEKLVSLLNAVRKEAKLETVGALSVFVVPLPERGYGETSSNFAMEEAREVEEEGSLAWLLEEQRRWLSTGESAAVLASLMETQLSAGVTFVSDQSHQFAEGKGLPVARVVPLLSDAFGQITRHAGDSVFQQVLVNRRLHAYAKQIFHEDPTDRSD